MFSTVEQLESAALGLPASERARLAERPTASLDEDSEIERAWAGESEVFAKARPPRPPVSMNRKPPDSVNPENP